MLYWLGFIAILSLGLSLYSYKKEQEKHELDRVKEDLTKGKVIFHSSAGDASSSSS